MEGIVALVMIFGMPVFIVGISKFFNYKTKRLELEKKALPDPAQVKKLELLERDRAQLMERVENLETIVTSVDLELNARVNRLSAQQSYMALPQHAGDGGDASPTVDVAPTMLQQPDGGIEAGTVLMDRFQVERCLG